MKYKLVKQLEEAGFPREKCSMILKTANVGFSTDNPLLFPKLEELIKECGDVLVWKSGDFWEADIFDGEGEIYIDQYFDTDQEYKTPFEAVANLWLRLNKKK